jgi:ribosomal protein L37AE/L43A
MVFKKMVAYKIVKYCRMCKTRFVVMREESKINLCEDCRKRMAKIKEAEEKNEESKED